MNGGPTGSSRRSWPAVAAGLFALAAAIAATWLLPTWAINLRGVIRLGIAAVVGLVLVVRRRVQHHRAGGNENPALPGAPAAMKWGPPVPVPPPPAGYQPYEPQPVDSMKWIVPINLSPWAVAAGYAGLFCPIILPGPIALLLGLKALRDLDAHPERRGRGRAVFGVIAGLLATVVLGGLTLAILAEQSGA